MKIYKNYLETEVNNLIGDNRVKRTKSYDNRILVRCLIYMIPLLTFGLCQGDFIECPCCSNSIEYNVVAKEALWRCRRCNRQNWAQDPDWKGDYYCNVCGTRKGDD